MANQTQILAGNDQETISTPVKMTFQMIKAAANDNLMPTRKWLSQIIAWTTIVGSTLAYAIF